MTTNFPSGVTSFGIPVVAGSVPATFGTVFFVDYANGSDGNSGKSSDQAFKTLTQAYNSATTDKDDIILIRGGSSVVDAPIAWSKNRIHVIGVDAAPGRLVDQGAKISMTTTGTTAYMLLVTGVRNSFVNLKFIQNSVQATALNVVQDGGEGTLWQNCMFEFGTNTNYGLTTCSEFVAGSDSNTYLSCTFGSDTLLTTVARPVFLIKKVTTGQEFKSNVLQGCKFNISSSNSSALLVKVNSIDDVLFTNLFDHCVFQASVDSAGGVALSNAVASASGLVKGTLNFAYPAAFNCTKVCAGVTDQVKVVGPAAAASGGVCTTPA